MSLRCFCVCVFNLQCRSSPHRCRPCSQCQHHTSSGTGYSDRSYTETGRYHTSHHSHAVKYTHSKYCNEYLLFMRVIIDENSTEVCFPATGVNKWFCELPHQIHQCSHDLHHTSICQQYSDHWCRQTHSQSTAWALTQTKHTIQLYLNNIFTF